MIKIMDVKELFKNYVISEWGIDTYERVKNTDKETFAVRFLQYLVTNDEIAIVRFFKCNGYDKRR